MIFNFRMLSDEDENFLRDYEIPYSLTLKDFHNFICDDLEYDQYEMSSFFLSDNQWQKLQEFTIDDMGMESVDDGFPSPIPMENITLGEIIHDKFQRLLYVFDVYEDRAFFLELLEAKKESDGVEYPRVQLANGEAPDQFDSSKSKGNRSIFEEAMDDWGDYEGDDSYDDEYY